MVHANPSLLSLNSNPVVQQQALALGCLNSLLPSLHPSGDPESDTLQRRALFAISNILRHNRDAQQHFIVTLDGLHVVGRDLQDRSTKYQIKALVFLTDMLNELVCTCVVRTHIASSLLFTAAKYIHIFLCCVGICQWLILNLTSPEWLGSLTLFRSVHSIGRFRHIVSTQLPSSVKATNSTPSLLQLIWMLVTSNDNLCNE